MLQAPNEVTSNDVRIGDCAVSRHYHSDLEQPEPPITIGRSAVLLEVPVIQLLPRPLFYHPYAV
jgi:hypothetical protein